MIDPLAWIDDEAAEWSARGLARGLDSHGPVEPGRFVRKGRTYINFGANDYLGLAADPRVVEAAQSAAKLYGWGAGASALVCGWTEAHQRLAEALAAFEHAEAAHLFPTGYAANLGTVAALVERGDVVYSDRLNHACLIDGVRLSGASLRVFPHNDVGRLGSILERDKGRFRRSLIATEGVFSMDGDLAPLAGLADLAEGFDAILLVDEAHATGLLGPDGQGASSACGVSGRVHVRVGTLSKAIGSLGGFVVGSRRLIDWLVNHARTQIYSTSLPAAAASAALEALKIATAEPWRRRQVLAHAIRVRTALRERGLDVGTSVGPIVPVILGESERVICFAEKFRSQGFFVPAIRPPTVPAGTARLRICLSAAHTESDVDSLIEVMTRDPDLRDVANERRDR